MDTDWFVFSFIPKKVLYTELKHFSKTLDPSKIDPKCELYSDSNKKMIGEVKRESSAEIELAEAVILWSKTSFFK